MIRLPLIQARRPLRARNKRFSGRIRNAFDIPGWDVYPLALSSNQIKKNQIL